MDNTRSKGKFSKRKGTIGQRERMKDARHDPYQEKRKWPEGTRCKECGAYYTSGRWSWVVPSPLTHETLCPACRRIADQYPAGALDISGDFFKEREKELVGLLRNVEAAENQEHPLERIMSVRREDDRLSVLTTGVHLARRLGDALEHAFQGTLTVQYGDNEHHVRVYWQR